MVFYFTKTLYQHSKMLRGFFETVICLYFNLIMAYKASNPKTQYLEERIMDAEYYYESDEHVHLAPIQPIHDIEMGSNNGCAKCKKEIYCHEQSYAYNGYEFCSSHCQKKFSNEDLNYQKQYEYSIHVGEHIL
jgi:endogenous inhibitor of DNA gyrase (YacG/DUF329 family)